jgi:hypothetical protein
MKMPALLQNDAALLLSWARAGEALVAGMVSVWKSDQTEKQRLEAFMALVREIVQESKKS